ncbi:MAG: hypothetical protein JWM91_3135 [Rhodospirillales bacterium]|nr:hypothetical protein [Rhodospirillales bacterium]
MVGEMPAEGGHAIFVILGSQAGGERTAILHAELKIAKLNGLDPERYSADVL